MPKEVDGIELKELCNPNACPLATVDLAKGDSGASE